MTTKNNHKADYSNLLSENECLQIVSKACGEVQLKSYDIQPASSDIVGYLGDYYKLNVVCLDLQSNQYEHCFFIKSLPLDNELHKDEIVSKGFMEKERLSYSTLFKDMDEYSLYKWHAEAYFVRKDLIVFEDLLQSGYKVEKLSFDFPSTHVFAVLECLAGMHANSIVFEEKSGRSIETDYWEVAKDNSLQGNTWYTTGLKAICKVASVHGKFQSQNYQHFIKNHLRDRLNIVYELAKSSKVYKNTISHRDLWEKNILFKLSENGLKSVFVDFQITCYIPPSFDVLFFLYLNTTKSNRDTNMRDYIDFYYNCLKKYVNNQDIGLDEILSRKDFDEVCEKFEEIALIATGVYSPISYLPDGYLGSINQKNPKEFIEIMNVDRDDFVVDCIRKFPNYGERVLGVVEEIVDRLYTNQK